MCDGSKDDFTSAGMFIEAIWLLRGGTKLKECAKRHRRQKTKRKSLNMMYSTRSTT